MSASAVTAAGLAATRATSLAASLSGSGIGFDSVTVAYKGQVALNNLSLSIEPGEIMAIIGPSGCGKTTALRAVAGFVRPTAGRIRIGERDVTDLAPYARDIGMVVQNYALFPHMRVDQNVAFGLRARGADAGLIETQVRECLRLVGMTDFASRYPRQLSGGQQQRVAIARALAIRPRVLLLDEPLSALDAQIRRSMLDELARLHRDLPHLTVLYVTHDQIEALTLADRIAIMRGGKLIAHGPSQRLYHEPPNRFAAEFLGRANLLPVELQDTLDGVAVVRLGDRLVRARMPHGKPAGAARLCVRPHALKFSDDEADNSFHATVTDVTWQGDLLSIELDVAGETARMVCTPLREPPRRGARVEVHFATDDATLIAEDAGE
jgi:2-aminoethylphosphonate transport system ATP-binding protein